MSDLLPLPNRHNSEAGRNQAEAEESSPNGVGGVEKGYLNQAVELGQGVVVYGVETGKWVWARIREMSARVMGA